MQVIHTHGHTHLCTCYLLLSVLTQFTLRRVILEQMNLLYLSVAMTIYEEYSFKNLCVI